MVSSSLKMELDELLATLERMRQEDASDPNYQELRGDLPADWPM